jgi:hypothetical protein
MITKETIIFTDHATVLIVTEYDTGEIVIVETRVDEYPLAEES